MCAKSTIIQNKRQGQKFCKICQCFIENEEEHMKRKHPDVARYLQKREAREDLTICGLCGRMVKNWREHIQESHPEEIARHIRKKKPKKEESEREDLTKMFNL